MAFALAEAKVDIVTNFVSLDEFAKTLLSAQT
jgi:hypothetical protein